VVEVVTGCGHFVWLERPGEIGRAVGAFLAGER
jgi:pimeloyl-ACP methyl ester carboxylesterase